MIAATSNYPLLSICAAKRTNGSLTLLVINKSATAALNSNITIGGATPGTTGTLYSYGIPQDTAAQTGVGSADVASSAVSGLGSTFSFDFPAYSANVIVLGASAPPPPVRQPDNLVKASGDASYLGEGIFNITAAGQTRSVTVKPGGAATFIVEVQNDGSATDSFTLAGTNSTSALSVKYYTGSSGGTNITPGVTAGTYTIPNLAAGGSTLFHFTVTAARKTASGTSNGFLVTTTSQGNPAAKDAVEGLVTVN
jgi:hypothetical protein